MKTINGLFGKVINHNCNINIYKQINQIDRYTMKENCTSKYNGCKLYRLGNVFHEIIHVVTILYNNALGDKIV